MNHIFYIEDKTEIIEEFSSFSDLENWLEKHNCKVYVDFSFLVASSSLVEKSICIGKIISHTLEEINREYSLHACNLGESYSARRSKLQMVATSLTGFFCF